MDEQKMNTFIGQVLGDLGGAVSIGLVIIGGKLGLYQALHSKGPLSSEELAKETSLAERYVREWAAAQAASNYIAYSPANGKYSMPPEQAAVFADPESPMYMVPGFEAAAAYLQSQDKVEEAFKTGDGVAWGEQGGCLFCAVARFFRPGYKANLIQQWLPALDGVVDKLKAGAKVADVGCGHGYSTVLMAEAFPKSEFIGFDFHPDSIAEANKHAQEHGVADRCSFEVGGSTDYPGNDYDLITFFDCLHDMGDPAGASAHVCQSLKSDGTWMVVEPNAGDSVEENLNPVGRLFYSASTMVCVPCSLSQDVGAALGAQAGEKVLRETITSGGFSRFRRATETPFNMILEARP